MQILITSFNLAGWFIIIVLIKELLNAIFDCFEFYRNTYIKNPTGWTKRKLRWYLLIHLPNELIASLVVFGYIFLLFNHRASWLFLIAFSGYLFKKIIQDPIYILHSYCLNFICRKEEIKPRNTALANIFPNAIYMPHLGYSESEIDQALSTLCLSYLNNKNWNTSLIYHSDNKNPDFILKALRKLKYLAKKLKIDNFIFLQRDISSHEKNFLGKPGAYLADYQLLSTGITHPVIYIEKEWDARVQFKCQLDTDSRIVVEKPHLPFLLPDKIESGFTHFIYYPHPKPGFYIKESLKLTTSKGRTFFTEVETKLHLISKINPKTRFLLHLGGIYTHNGDLILRPEEWTIQATGIITHKTTHPKLPLDPYQIIIQKTICLDGVKCFVDKDLNILNKELEIIIPHGEFSIKHHYQLYQRQNDFLYLVEDNFEPLKEKLIGEDFRRDPLNLLHKIPTEVMEEIETSDDFNYFEKKQLRKTGIWDSKNSFKNFKFGWEKEFLIKDTLIKNRCILKGGYYLIDADKIPLDIFHTPNMEIKTVLAQDNIYGLDKDEKIPLLTLKGDPVLNIDGKILVKAPYVEFFKESDTGFIVNEKDGFLYRLGMLYFCGEKNIYPVSKNVWELKKHLIYIEPASNNLIKKTLIASPGGYKLKNNSVILKKKLLSNPFSVFIENRMFKIKDPLSNKILSLDNCTLDEYGIWLDEKETELSLSEHLKFQAHYIFQEEIIAKHGEYTINDNFVETDGVKHPLGINICHENSLLKHQGQTLRASISFMIINQVDSDGEFLKDALCETNAILTEQLLLDEFEYGMIQPEISFANSSDSLFARLLSWAHEEFKFAERAFFNTYKEGNSYGKVSKALPLYIGNILFKESIPAIARTHDHWEAMHLRTLFQFSGKHKGARLIENVPSNFYSFLKRKQGWLTGDVLLLELESKTGTLISLLRSIKSFLSGRTKAARYWIQYAQIHRKMLKQSKKNYTALGLQRILTLRRTALSTTYLMLWLMLCGWLALIIPGSLSIQSSLLSWILFLTSVLLIIVLPKFFIPLTNTILKEIKTFSGFCFIAFTIYSVIITNDIITRHPQSIVYSAILGYSYILIRSLFLPLFFIILGSRRRLRVRLGTLTLLLLCLLLLLNGYDILHYLSTSKKFYWITLLFLSQLPYVWTYLIPIYVISRFSRLGKKLFSNLKEGAKELLATTSTLLMHLVYEPIHIIRVFLMLIKKPFSKIAWFPQSYFDRIAANITSLPRAYCCFYLPPLFCLIFIIIPLKLHILPPQILSLGWPIFIWSWLLGPFWAYWTCRHRKNLHRIIPSTLIIRQVLNQSLVFTDTNPTKFNKILADLPYQIDEEEKIRLYLYFFTEKTRLMLPKKNRNILDRIANKTARISSDARVTDWETLSEFSRVKIIKQFRKYLDKDLLKQISFYSDLLFNMLKKGWAEVEWQNLSETEQSQIINTLRQKHAFNPEF
ncbi:MAG: hypothetical protein P9M06_01475 [Candidatus Saelkia tenebricola]|nr:hypothetical protein [Candidatus Saelkia tenebricola]